MKKFLIILVSVLLGLQGLAQISKTSSDHPRGIWTIKGDYYFDHQMFSEAVDYYRRAIKEKPTDVHSMLRMAEAFSISGNNELAASWFSLAINTAPNVTASYIPKYVFTLVDNKMYDEARKWINIYNEKLGVDIQGDKYKDTTIYVVQHIKSINSSNADISALLYKSRLIFVSNRFDSLNNPNNKSYNLYEAQLTDSQYGDIKPLHEDINAVVSKGPVAIAPDAEKMFFNGNDPSINAGSTRIYFCDVPENQDDKAKIKQLSFRDFERNASHPAVNNEGKAIYFVAENKAEGRGLDIYRSEGRGRKWSEPKVLGQNINTNGDELYPYLHNDSILYFASNGHGGLGGFDVFKVNVLDKDAEVENLGPPVNTASDDFGFFINENAEVGFISSNRPGGAGDVDIYKLEVINFKIKNERIENTDIYKPASITIYESDGNEITLTGDVNENIRFSVVPGLNYKLFIDKDNYNELLSGKMNNTDDPPILEASNGMELTDGDQYNFLIKKYVETGMGWNGLFQNTVLKNLQANPGDLITFRFIPDHKAQSEISNSVEDTKLEFKNDMVRMNIEDTLVIGYTVEEAPNSLDKDKRELLSDMKPIEGESLSMDEKAPDTTLLAENTLSSKEQGDNTADSIDAYSDNAPGNVSPLADQHSDNEAISPSDTLAQHEVASAIVADNETKTSEDQENIPIDSSSVDPNEELVAANKKGIKDQSDTLSSNLQLNTENANELLTSSLDETKQSSDSTEETNAIAENLEMANEYTVANNSDSLSINTKGDSAKFIAKADQQPVDTLTADPQLALNEEKRNSDEAKLSALNEATDPTDSTAQPEKTATVADDEANIKYEKDDSLNIDSEKTPTNLEAKSYPTNDSSVTSVASLQSISKEQSTSSISGNNVSNQNETDQQIQYRVQIAASRVALNDSDLLKIYSGNRSIDHFRKDGYFKYYIAEVPDYAVANKIRRACGVDGAFIVKHIIENTGTLAHNALNDNTNGTPAQTKMDPVNPQPTDTSAADPQLTAKYETHHSDQSPANAIDPEDNTVQMQDTLSIAGSPMKANDNMNANNSDSLSINTKRESAKTIAKTDQQPEDTLAAESQLAVMEDERNSDESRSSTLNEAMIPSDSSTQPKKKAKNVDEEARANYEEDEDSDVDQEIVLADAKAVDSQRTDSMTTDSQMTTNTGTLTSADNDDAIADNEASSNIRYRVQIAATKRALKDTDMKKIYRGKREIDHFNEEGYFKYYIAEVPSYFVAKNILNESGVDNAFIAAYKGNTKLKLEEALYAQYKEGMKKNGLEVAGTILKIAVVNFEFDKFILLPDEKLRLSKSVIDKLMADEKLYAIVNGHTDIKGSNTYNFGLSEERALFVRKLIIDEGIEPERVEMHYFGESQLARYCDDYENCDESVHEANRRVEVILLESR